MISFVCRLQSADSRDTQRAIRHITALRADCYSTNEYSIFFFNRDANFYFTILRLISVCRRRRRRRSLCTYESEFSLSLDAIENGRTKIEQWSLRLSDAVITNLVIAVFSRHLKIVRILHVDVHVSVCVCASKGLELDWLSQMPDTFSISTVQCKWWRFVTRSLDATVSAIECA